MLCRAFVLLKFINADTAPIISRNSFLKNQMYTMFFLDPIALDQPRHV